MFRPHLLAAGLLSVMLAGPASAWYRSGPEEVEIGFSMKLFGSATNTDAIPVAQGIPEFPFQVQVSSKVGELKCAAGKTGTGPDSASRQILKPETVAASSFTMKISNGEEIVCHSTEDRKIEVVYRFKKNILENAFADQIKQTIAELKQGKMESEVALAVMKAALDASFRSTEFKVGRAEVMVLDNARPKNTSMVTIIMAEPLKMGGTTIQPSGKKKTADKSNLYPALNRFALVCGFVNEKDGTIDQPLVPNDDRKVSYWMEKSPGKPFGCIVNNSPDGFDAIDPYVEDPAYQIRYLMLPEADLLAGLDKLRIQITETIDGNRAEKLEGIAKRLLESNKKLVQVELDRRRMEALKEAGYALSYPVDLQPRMVSLSLTGKPRYTPGAGRHVGELKPDTVFDIQSEKVNYEFKWIDGTSVNFTEERPWVGLSVPLVSQDFDMKYVHFIREYQICAGDSPTVQAYLTRVSKAPNSTTSEDLLKSLERGPAPCKGLAPVERRELKYVRYEGSCFTETMYTPKDGNIELVRYKPGRVDIVYADAKGHAVARVPLDLAKLGQSQNLFAGLDVITTLPYNAAKAGTYKLRCEGSTGLPAGRFTEIQLEDQRNVPGFQSLLSEGTNVGPAVAPEKEKEAPRKKANPKAGIIEL
jgi:hypothetical protein